jgi:hypothetical protein
MTHDPQVLLATCAKYCTVSTVTSKSCYVSLSDRVCGVLIHTEKERVGVRLTDVWGFKLSCCEAAKDEVSGCLDDGQTPSPWIATSMEIIRIPPVRVRIINLLECSLRKVMPNKFHDHFTMGWSNKGLWISKIFFGIFLETLVCWNYSLRNWKVGFSRNRFCLSIFKLFLS